MFYLLIFILIYSLICPMNPLRLDMAIYPPYTYTIEGQLEGYGYEFVREVMEEAHLSYAINPVPNYGRAFKDMVDGRSDGFFPASRNDNRDLYAVFSTAIDESQWTWVAEKYRAFDLCNIQKKDVVVGVQLNSNLHNWLVLNGYNVITVGNVESLLRFFDTKRADIIFIPKAVFLESIKKENRSIGEFDFKVENTKDLGIYISKDYLVEDPGIIDRINNAVEKVKAKRKMTE